MAHAVHTPFAWVQRRRSMSRTRHRPWARPNDPRYETALLARIPGFPRATLARLTELLIDRMDEIDGDRDFEDLRDDHEDTHNRERDDDHK